MKSMKVSEKERVEAFKSLDEDLINKGYKRTNLTISISKVNIFSLLLTLPFVILYIFLYIYINKINLHISSLSFRIKISYLALFIVLYIGLVITHEIIHGLVFGFFCKNKFKSISFGIITEYFTPYCSCMEPLKKYQYIIGILMPTIVLGFGLGSIAIVIESPFILALSSLMLIGGGGDFYGFLLLLKFKPKSKKVVYIDHPNECGCVVYEK